MTKTIASKLYLSFVVTTVTFVVVACVLSALSMITHNKEMESIAGYLMIPFLTYAGIVLVFGGGYMYFVCEHKKYDTNSSLPTRPLRNFFMIIMGGVPAMFLFAQTGITFDQIFSFENQWIEFGVRLISFLSIFSLGGYLYSYSVYLLLRKGFRKIQPVLERMVE
jgi:hypothetical protein